jgi:hypothetical protein
VKKKKIKSRKIAETLAMRKTVTFFATENTMIFNIKGAAICADQQQYKTVSCCDPQEGRRCSTQDVCNDVVCMYVSMYVVEGVEGGEGACSFESSDGLTGGGARNKLSCKKRMADLTRPTQIRYLVGAE